jgi:XTP/dITP diphosphohydrolase
VPSADAVALAAFLSSAVSYADGPVVWLAPPGSEADPELLSRLSVPCLVLNGSHDLPGAHLLDLVSIIDTLRVSCLWDGEQTHESLLRYLLEEAYEAAEAIETGDLAALREEIGDVMFQAFFHARIAAERPVAEGGFTIDDVVDTLAAKLFAGIRMSSAPSRCHRPRTSTRTEKRSRRPRGRPRRRRLVSLVGRRRQLGRRRRRYWTGCRSASPRCPPAVQLQRRTGRAGVTVSFDGGAAVPGADADAVGLTGEDIGEALMALVARAREAGLDPELELRAAARRFAGSVCERERPAGPAQPTEPTEELVSARSGSRMQQFAER